MRNYLENSKMISLFKIIYGKSTFLKRYVHNSYIRGYIHNSKQTLKRYFQRTLLLKIMDKISYQDASESFNGSRFIRFLLFVYNSIKFQTNHYLEKSKFIGLSNSLRGAFYFTPLKAGGIILSCTIMTKFLLMVILNKKISCLDFTISVFFLLLALVSLTSGADWESLRKSSRIIR